MKRRKERLNVYNIIHYKQTCGKHFSFSDSSNSNKVNNKFKGEMTLNGVASFSEIQGGGLMFFDMFTKEKIVYAEDDYKLLDNQSISAYDNKAIEDRIKHLISNVQEMECKYLDFIISNITVNYELKPEMFTTKKSDSTCNTALKRIQTAEDLQTAYNRFNFIFNNLFCYYEKVVFVEMLLLKRTKDATKQMLCIGSDKLYQIKKSLLVKLAIGLQWEDIKK